HAGDLGLCGRVMGKQGLEELQSIIKYLEPQNAPIIFRERVILLGARKIFSFSIHPHANRWLQDRREVAWPENWQPIFNSEILWRGNNLEIPIALTDSREFALLTLSREAI